MPEFPIHALEGNLAPVMPTVLPTQLLPATRKIHPNDLGIMDNRPPSQLSLTAIQLLQQKQMQSIITGMKFFGAGIGRAEDLLYYYIMSKFLFISSISLTGKIMHILLPSVTPCQMDCLLCSIPSFTYLSPRHSCVELSHTGRYPMAANASPCGVHCCTHSVPLHQPQLHLVCHPLWTEWTISDQPSIYWHIPI